MNSKYKKPQINTDERRCILATGFADFFASRVFPITESGRTTHRKERKAVQQKSSRSGVGNRSSINNEL
ncbi:hypothetical protein, partial [Candidatus Methanoperedens nitratireducens]|uniref:hypothetical protein n=1 Tax=Candidatus Methanoperedens nitratireducens TaxID=1392998 RepID=UPI001C547C79